MEVVVNSCLLGRGKISDYMHLHMEGDMITIHVWLFLIRVRTRASIPMVYK